MPAWRKAGKLTIECVQCLIERVKLDIPTIIVDLRSPDEAKKGHIAGAVSIPITEISAAYEKFPRDKRAPIVLYSHDTKSAVQAFEIVSVWGGFTHITVLEGGYREWIKIGGKIAKGDMPNRIVWEPKPRPGAISVEEFKAIAEKLPVDKFILDVRDSDEAENGMLIGAKNIPAQDVLKRLVDIPKNKEVIVHCLTGVRAELAFHALRDAGYKARFLNAIIKIDSSGRYEITKE